VNGAILARMKVGEKLRGASPKPQIMRFPLGRRNRRDRLVSQWDWGNGLVTNRYRRDRLVGNWDGRNRLIRNGNRRNRLIRDGYRRDWLIGYWDRRNGLVKQGAQCRGPTEPNMGSRNGKSCKGESDDAS